MRLKQISAFVTYPSTAAVIGILWLSLVIFVVIDPNLPVIKMVAINMLASFFMGFLGFRVKK